MPEKWLSLQTVGNKLKRISTVGPLSGLVNLESLILQSNLVSDLSPLLGLNHSGNNALWPGFLAKAMLKQGARFDHSLLIRTAVVTVDAVQFNALAISRTVSSSG